MLDRQSFIPLVTPIPYTTDKAYQYRIKRSREVVYGSSGLTDRLLFLDQLNAPLYDRDSQPRYFEQTLRSSQRSIRSDSDPVPLMGLDELNAPKPHDTTSSSYNIQPYTSPRSGDGSLANSTSKDAAAGVTTQTTAHNTVPTRAQSSASITDTGSSSSGGFFDFFKKVTSTGSKTTSTTTNDNNSGGKRTSKGKSNNNTTNNNNNNDKQKQKDVIVIKATFPIKSKSNNSDDDDDDVVLDEVDVSQANAIYYTPTTASPLPLFSSRNVAIVVGENGFGRIVTCGFWDNSIRVHALDLSKEIAVNCQNNSSAFTCVQYGSNGSSTFVTGSGDGLCRVWVLEKPEVASAFASQVKFDSAILGSRERTLVPTLSSDDGAMLVCAHILWGHDSAITALSFNSELQLVLSGSSSGLLCIHSVRNGAFVRSIDRLKGHSIDVVLLASCGYVVAHTGDGRQIHLFWINGTHIRSIEVANR